MVVVSELQGNLNSAERKKRMDATINNKEDLHVYSVLDRVRQENRRSERFLGQMRDKMRCSGAIKNKGLKDDEDVLIFSPAADNCLLSPGEVMA